MTVADSWCKLLDVIAPLTDEEQDTVIWGVLKKTEGVDNAPMEELLQVHKFEPTSSIFTYHPEEMR